MRKKIDHTERDARFARHREAAAKLAPEPTPIETDQRICFGIKWFATEAEAILHGEHMKAYEITYNGGWFHGMQCGRDPSFDREVDGVKRYASTF